MTEELAVIGLWGPRARTCSAVAEDDVGDGASVPRRADDPVGGSAVLVQRITYVGELGFELYVAPEWAVQVWDRLMAAGEPRTSPAATGRSSRCGSRRATAISEPI